MSIDFSYSISINFLDTQKAFPQESLLYPLFRLKRNGRIADTTKQLNQFLTIFNRKIF